MFCLRDSRGLKRGNSLAEEVAQHLVKHSSSICEALVMIPGAGKEWQEMKKFKMAEKEGGPPHFQNYS